jgi:hypothetical protein
MRASRDARKPQDVRIAYVVEQFDERPARPRYEGHWQKVGKDQTPYVADAAGWDAVGEAIGWGRARAPVVILRAGQGGSTRHWSAGVTRRRAILGEAIEEWPGLPAFSSSMRMRDYGGVVFISEMPVQFTRTGFFVPVLQAGYEGTEHVHVLETGPETTDVEWAISWGRNRSPYVIVKIGRPSHSYYSAGDRAPPGLSLPRWREPRFWLKVED